MKLIIQPDAGLVPLVQAIRRARRNVDIAIFRLNRLELETALAGAVQRGVKVRALVAHTNRGGEARLRKLEQRLLAGGIMVSRTSDDLLKYHGKYMLIDDVLHLLGFNYTKADTTRSRSFGVQTRNRRATKDAARLFECDLTHQPYQGSPKSPLVVSPETSRDALLAFIKGARHRLAIYDARLEDPTFVALLRQKSDAGVQIQVIGRAPRLTQHTEVRALKDLRLHVRAVIRDGTQAFVGSQSLRRLELERRREVGLIINNPAVARKMLEVFDRDWESCAPGREAEPDEAKDAKQDKSDKPGKDEKNQKDEKKAEKTGHAEKANKDDKVRKAKVGKTRAPHVPARRTA